MGNQPSSGGGGGVVTTNPPTGTGLSGPSSGGSGGRRPSSRPTGNTNRRPSSARGGGRSGGRSGGRAPGGRGANSSSNNGNPRSPPTNNISEPEPNPADTNTPSNPFRMPTMTLPTVSLPFSTTGSLKLSRAELDRRCTPSGLYPTTPWDSRTIRRLIGNGQLAARLPGSDARSSATDQECPICFLHYAQVNITKCCSAAVCTECYLQVKPQKEKNSPCPFCNAPKLSVKVAKSLTGSQVKERDREEQRIIEAQIEARKMGLTGESGHSGANSIAGAGSGSSSFDEAPSTPQPYRVVEESNMQSTTGGTGTAPNTPQMTPPPPRPGEFGSALHRMRTESFASDGTGAASTDGSAVSLTLTPTQRSQIHAQLQSQNEHPLARAMAREAQQRREENEREYLRTHSDRLIERYEEYQRRARHSRAMADQMLLRAHGIPTRGDAGLSAGAGGLAPRNDTGDGAAAADAEGGDGSSRAAALAAAMGASGGNLDDLMVIEAALMLSMEEEADRRRREQQDGAEGRRRSGDEGEADGNGDAEAADGSGNGSGSAGLNRSLQQPDLQPRSQSVILGGRGGRSRRRLLRPGLGARGPSSTHIGTAGMLMRGISEDDQIAMAIALSLRENQEAAANNNNDEDSNNNEEDQAEGGSAGASRSSSANGDDDADGENAEAEDSSEEAEHVQEQTMNT